VNEQSRPQKVQENEQSRLQKVQENEQSRLQKVQENEQSRPQKVQENEQSRLQKVKDAVKEVEDKMVANINILVERGEKLEGAMKTTAELLEEVRVHKKFS
ncbi:hypothetical protein CRUP_033228, partial [Coryphaenoides rupestris]